jgi:hypothetical protein
LKDLNKYSRTLYTNEKKYARFSNSLFNGKYMKTSTKTESPDSSPREGKIEWKNTPIYKQFVLKLNEVESFMGSGY